MPLPTRQLKGNLTEVVYWKNDVPTILSNHSRVMIYLFQEMMCMVVDSKEILFQAEVHLYIGKMAP